LRKNNKANCKNERKKYRVLKTNKMEENVSLERHFKSIIEPLKRLKIR